MAKPIQAQYKVAILAATFVTLLILASGAYWFRVVKPVLQSDLQSLSSSMASARANELATMLSRVGVSDPIIDDTLQSMLAYTYERTGERFFVSLELVISEEYAIEKSLSTRFSFGESHCGACVVEDYPLYSVTDFRLMGILSIAISNTQTHAYIDSVRRLFVTGLILVVVALMVVLFVIWNMTSVVDSLNAQLSHEVAKRTQSLEEEVSQHKHTQQQLHRARDEVQRLERSRIAKTLHDGVGQVLQALKLGLQRLGAKMEGEDKQLVNELVEDTADMIGIIRDFCSELRPLHLERMSLSQALFTHIERLDRRLLDMSLTMELSEHIRMDLSEMVKEQLFLIAAELINNAVKHSQAKAIHVRLYDTHDTLWMTIEDNGVGFDTQCIPQSSCGLGVSLTQERCERIHAQLNIQSTIGKGTHITCSLPTQQGVRHD